VIASTMFSPVFADTSKYFIPELPMKNWISSFATLGHSARSTLLPMMTKMMSCRATSRTSAI
jgi:hypothetical protein